MERWPQVRRDLGRSPITEGMIGGESPLYVERYLFRGIEKSVVGIGGIGLLTQFGGARVQEGQKGQRLTTVFPSQSLLLPANYATHWHYAGTVDFAVFYFPDQMTGVQDRLRWLAESKREPFVFADPLVGAAALRLVNELQKGPAADERFMILVTQVMLEQTYRALTTPETGTMNPRHVHFERLQKVLAFIREHLAEDLPAELLAAQLQVSLAHFRRLFQEAMGAPPHRYILSARLEQARKLLTTTTLPIAHIAQDCGFSSQSHLTASFRAAHATTPADYRAHVNAKNTVSG